MRVFFLALTIMMASINVEAASSFGSFFTTYFSPVDTKNPIVALDQTARKSSNITLTTKGGVLLKEQGDYLVTFGASVASMQNPTDQDNPNVQLGLFINGVFQKGSNFTIPPTSINEINSLSCIVHSSAPSQELVIKFLNSKKSLFSLGSLTPGDVTACITVQKL